MKKHFLKDKSVFIGGGVPLSTYLWLLPLIDGYCKKNNIKSLIFEENLPDKIAKKEFIKNILNKYSIKFPFKKNFFTIVKFFFYFIKIKTIIIFFSLIFLRKNKITNDNNTTFETFLYHSLWDTTLQKNNYYFLYPNFFGKIESAIKIIHRIYMSDYLIKRRINSAFMIHAVYHHRMLFFYLVTNAVKVFLEGGNFNLILHKSFYNNFDYTEKKSVNKLVKFFSKKKIIINNYWNLRLRGKGNRIESYTPGFRNTSNYKEYISNVIMLPVLKDSAFSNIDKNRIFIDCFDWLIHTLQIISHSKEKWIIKSHPSSNKWGENTKRFIDLIFNNHFFNHTNVKYLENISNSQVFKNAKRIVTFNGTSQIESGCYGIKPISISRIGYNFYSDKLAFIPRSKVQYSNLLLKSSNSNIFKLNKKEVFACKFFIFYKEKVVSLSEIIGKYNELRNDSIAIKNSNFSLIYEKVLKNKHHIYKQGQLLGDKTNITVNKNFIKYY
jgi:hypothetical protein